LFISTGLAKFGYDYVNLDDCWEAPSRINGSLAANPTTFPSGLKALSDYIHAKGLKMGIYSSAGYYTCQHRPASLGHEVIDAQFFARFVFASMHCVSGPCSFRPVVSSHSQGIDYLKYDNCNTDGSAPEVCIFPSHETCPC
jgi:alpha-galactosidase